MLASIELPKVDLPVIVINIEELHNIHNLALKCKEPYVILNNLEIKKLGMQPVKNKLVLKTTEAFKNKYNF